MTDSRIAEVLKYLAGATYALNGEKPGLYWARSELSDALKIVEGMVAEREAAAKAEQRDAA